MAVAGDERLMSATRELTSHQMGVIDQLVRAGYEEASRRAFQAWSSGIPFPLTMLPADASTALRADVDKANREVTA